MKYAKKQNVVISKVRMSKMPMNTILNKHEPTKIMTIQRSSVGSNTNKISNDISNQKGKISDFLKNEFGSSIVKKSEEKRKISSIKMHRRSKSETHFSPEKKDKVIHPNEIYDLTNRNNLFFQFRKNDEEILKKKLNELMIKRSNINTAKDSGKATFFKTAYKKDNHIKEKLNDLDLNSFLKTKPMRLFNKTSSNTKLELGKNSSSIFRKDDLTLFQNEIYSRKILTAKPKLSNKINDNDNNNNKTFQKIIHKNLSNSHFSKVDIKSKDFLHITSLNEKFNFPQENYKDISLNIFQISKGKYLNQLRKHYSHLDNIKSKGFESVDLSKSNMVNYKDRDSPMRIVRPKINNKEIISSITNPKIKCEIKKKIVEANLNSFNKNKNIISLKNSTINVPKKMIFTKKITHISENYKEEIEDYPNYPDYSFEESEYITSNLKNEDFEQEYKIFEDYEDKIISYANKNV